MLEELYIAYDSDRLSFEREFVISDDYLYRVDRNSKRILDFVGNLSGKCFEDLVEDAYEKHYLPKNEVPVIDVNKELKPVNSSTYAYLLSYNDVDRFSSKGILIEYLDDLLDDYPNVYMLSENQIAKIYDELGLDGPYSCGNNSYDDSDDDDIDCADDCYGDDDMD